MTTDEYCAPKNVYSTVAHVGLYLDVSKFNDHAWRFDCSLQWRDNMGVKVINFWILTHVPCANLTIGLHGWD